MKVLILGSLGQDGKYLTELHLGLGDHVIGLAKSIYPDSELEPTLLGATYLKLDARDPVELNKIINRYEPEIIYNLASASSVSESFNFPDISESVNVGIVKNILEILRRRQLEGKDQIKLFHASSSEMFGVSDGVPLTIKSKFNPHSPYALHKSIAHNLILEYREKFSLHLSTGILFNHESIRRKKKFVSRKISNAAYLISQGKQSNLKLGNIEISRDWGYAGDFVEAIRLISLKNTPGDFIVATGELHSLREMCRIAFATAGLDNFEKYLSIDESLFRPQDTNALVGDIASTSLELDWSPKTTFDSWVSQMVKLESDPLVAGE